MGLIRLNNQSLTDVTTLPAADGSSLTGLSAGGFQFIKKVNISTTNAVQNFTDLFSADYNHYRLIWDIVGEDTDTADTSHSFQFLKASDGLVDTTGDIDYTAHGIDSDGTGRSIFRNNTSFFNFLYNTVEDTKPAYYEMSVFAPFASKFTVVNSLQSYMVNDDNDATSSNGTAIRHNTTSYSGMKLVIVSTNNSVNPDVSCSATGTLLVYGMAEA